MEYDYSELMGAIKAKFGKRSNFALAMGMGESTLSLKLNNKAEWSQDEMKMAMDLLEKPYTEIPTYFFRHYV